MRSLVIVIFLFLTVALHVLSLGNAVNASRTLPKDEDRPFVLPSQMLKIVALEFRGLASDIFFLDSMVFIGGTQTRREIPRVKEWEWRWFAKTLDAATDLDPYFFDPYFYANAFLPWDAGMAEEANRILRKGSQYRDWDWMLPFFVGFNNFFFLKNDEEAAGFLMEASRRPGGDPLFASIAARLAFKENRTETAIYFLEETARNSANIGIKKRFELRIKALRSIVFLDKAVAEYKKKVGKMPATIEDLVNKEIINQLPIDPYGGRYYITQDGRVTSTASSELEPYLSSFAKEIRK